MESEESTWQTFDGHELFERRWRPAQPKAAVAIVHGLAEHSGRYEHVAQRLVAAGYATYALDLRGHGRSDGRRVFVRSADEHVHDVKRFLERVREREAGRPMFVLGHSMGGLIVTLMLTADAPDLRGAVLSGAALRSTRRSARLLQGLVRLLGRLLPRLPLARLDSADVSRDPAVVQRYDDDPLVFSGRMPAATARALILAGREIAPEMESITLPILILHGSEDALVDPESSRQLYERVSSRDKALKVYEGLYHEILNEPEQDQVMADIVAWLDERVS